MQVVGAPRGNGLDAQLPDYRVSPADGAVSIVNPLIVAVALGAPVLAAAAPAPAR